MTKFAWKGVSALAVVAVCAGVSAPANAADDISLQQAMQYFKYQDGNDRMRVELSPNWSDDLGFSMRGAIGGYLSDDLAIAAIVEYGEHKREILGNIGFNFNGDLTIIGTVGNLREELVFDPATGREAVDQMEYGVSLKGHMPILFASEFELNGYLADADTNSSNAIAGKVYGFQYKSIMNLSSDTQIKLGAGYEWLEWDDSTGNKDRFTGSIEAYQHLSENFALFGSGFFNTTESRYGGGIDFNLSPEGYNTNRLRLEYTHIDGHRGVQDDERVMATWSFGFGNAPTRYADAGSMSDSTGTVHAAADLAVPVANNRLLGEVMKRPTFLPQRAVVKGGSSCSINNYDGTNATILGDWDGNLDANEFQYTAALYPNDPYEGPTGTYDLYYFNGNANELIEPNVNIGSADVGGLSNLQALRYGSTPDNENLEDDFTGDVFFVALVNGECKSFYFEND